MRFLLYLFSLIYSLVIWMKNLFFDLGILSSKEYSVPIICIGNITAGGTGKTPHTEYLLYLLCDKKTAVLSRGYNRKKKGLVWVDVNSKPENVGDEPLQIKQKFPDTIVVVSGNRRKGIEEILKKHPETEVILMDDGFQHRWIKAGMNILLNNYENTIYSDSLLPLGRLRESKKAISRANIIITTKCPKMTPPEKTGINNQLNIDAYQNSFFSSIIYNNWKPISTSEKISTNEKYHITLVTSVANADNLKLHLDENRHIVNHLSFPDHHNFTKTDIENILSEYYSITSDKNIILSTEKDKVKLTNFKAKFNGIKLFFIPINIKIDREQEFNNLITDYVANHKRNR